MSISWTVLTLHGACFTDLFMTGFLLGVLLLGFCHYSDSSALTFYVFIYFYILVLH